MTEPATVQLHRGPLNGQVIQFGAQGSWRATIGVNMDAEHKVQYVRTDYFFNNENLGPIRLYLWNPYFIDAGVV